MPNPSITASEMAIRRWSKVSPAERSRLMRAAAAKAAITRAAKAQARKAALAAVGNKDLHPSAS